VELYTPHQVRKWLGISGLQAVFDLASQAGVTPQLVESPVDPRSRKWVLTRDQVMKILVAYYSKKGERLIHSSPKSASE